MEWLPCPHCGNKELKLLGNSLCALYGKKMANVYCEECQSQAPQKTWNKRKSVTQEQRKAVVLSYDFTDKTK